MTAKMVISIAEKELAPPADESWPDRGGPDAPFCVMP